MCDRPKAVTVEEYNIEMQTTSDLLQSRVAKNVN